MQTTVHFYTTWQLCGHKHLMPELGKANCAFPGPHSEKEEESTTEETRYQGVFPQRYSTQRNVVSTYGRHINL